MSILKVARMGHPVLRAKARPVERGDIGSATIQRLIDDMIDTMMEYHGVGLAAPQIHESLRIFVASLDAREEGEHEAEEPVVIINPELSLVPGETGRDASASPTCEVACRARTRSAFAPSIDMASACS
jgi:peptide deformylase